MTQMLTPDAPSLPFALPLRFEEETDHDIATPDYGWIWDAVLMAHLRAAQREGGS